MGSKKKIKICFAASSGGHYEQLMMLKPLMDKYDGFVITEKTDYWFNENYTTDGKMIHFGTSRTILPLYQVERRKVDFEWKYKKKWNAWAGCKSTIAAYIESLGLCIRSSKKLIFKRFKI